MLNEEEIVEVRERVAALRERLNEKGYRACLIPSTDPHLSEYVPDCWQRRAWISGFTGSAGDVVVTADAAGLWTDGRYFLQAERQLRGTGIELFRQGMPGVPSVEEYLASICGEGDRVAADPQVLAISRAAALEAALRERGARLALPGRNLVDAVWKGRPRLPSAPLRPHPTRFAGESLTSKLRRLRRALDDAGCEALVVSALDEIMWALNLRGRDVDYNPVAISYFVLERDRATLYVDPRKLTPAVRRHLGSRVATRPYREAGKGLRELGRSGRRVWVDRGNSSRWILDRLRGARLHLAPGPIAPMKARKNPVEQEGMRAAHRRDGVAMVRFLHWLEQEVRKGTVTEIGASDRLEALRAEGEHFQGLSFGTISGYAEHGAIIHYSATAETDVPLRPDGIYLLDSGAQYLDGTTDITRTLLLGGRATREQKERFTRVLMGHIDLAMARFPGGVRGLRLDTLARMPLWQAGLDYRHGTGHGVGSHLNVHEGPQSIGPRCTGAALEAGNVLSNEPGYYEDGAYGIRIENLVLVVENTTLGAPGESWLEFETLTLCPIDRRLIAPKLLRPDQKRWLDAYHRRVRRELSPALDRAERRWLAQACRPLG